MAAAGLWTTPSDLARIGIEVQRACGGAGKILSKQTAGAMLTPSPAGEDVGLGLFLEGVGAAARFGHGGWDEGFVARMTFYKDGGQGAVVMVNSNEGTPRGVSVRGGASVNAGRSIMRVPSNRRLRGVA